MAPKGLIMAKTAFSCAGGRTRNRYRTWSGLICKLTFSLVFTAYLSNTVVSGKPPFSFSGSRSSEAAGIVNRPPRRL